MYKEGQTVYRAEVNRNTGTVVYDEYWVRKPTPKGAWICHRMYRNEDFDELREMKVVKWIPFDARYASTSKKKAKERLIARTKSWLRHEWSRMSDAETAARVLGILKPGETLRQHFGEWPTLRSFQGF